MKKLIKILLPATFLVFLFFAIFTESFMPKVKIILALNNTVFYEYLATTQDKDEKKVLTNILIGADFLQEEDLKQEETPAIWKALNKHFYSFERLLEEMLEKQKETKKIDSS